VSEIWIGLDGDNIVSGRTDNPLKLRKVRRDPARRHLTASRPEHSL
jgi:hypothetical protein